MHVPFVDPLIQRRKPTPLLPLVGRERELFLGRTILENVVRDLSTGPRALTITGEMGVGKSRLLAEICEEAERLNFRVLSANTYEQGSMFPYFPFIEALRSLVRSSTPEQLQHYLSLDIPAISLKGHIEHNATISLSATQLMTSLARLFPELPGVVKLPISHEVLLPEQEKFRIFDAIATLLERVSREKPVLLCIDGLQWADSASLELTMYLTVRLHDSRVALIGVTRPQRIATGSNEVDEVAGAKAATRALTDLMRYGLLLVLPLSTLDEDAMACHLHALLPGELPPDVVGLLLERSEGNPFFLEELVRALLSSQQLVEYEGIWQMRGVTSTKLPDSIIHAVSQRLRSLPEGCHQMLQVAALFGRSFPFDALLQVLGQEEHAVQPFIGEALQAGIITTPEYTFCQGIVQEVLQNEVPSHRARILHQAIGKALLNSYKDEAIQHAAELARHFAAGGEREATLHWSLLAGEAAMAQQAYREAIGHFRLMLKLLTQGEAMSAAGLAEHLPSVAELYLTLGELWVKLGELEQAASSFQQALQRLQYASDATPLLVARTNRQLADVYRMQVKYDQAVAHHEAAQAALQLEVQARNEFDKQKIVVPWYPGRSFSAGPPSPRLEQINVSERVLFLQSRAMLDLLLNRPLQAEEALWEAHRLATELGDRASQAFVLHLVGYIRGWGEQIFEAIRLQEAANAIYIEIGDPYRAALGDQGLGIIYLILGDLERAHLYTLRGLERARRYGMQRMLASLHWNQAAMALGQGQWEQCESYLQQAMQEAIHNDDTRMKPAIIMTHAQLQFRRGNWSDAERLFLDAVHAGLSTEWYPGMLALYGHFLAVTGRRSAARSQLERAIQTPEPPGFAGHFYIPFLAEGYLHLDDPERAATYMQRISKLRGFMYYGHTVDRILGEVAARAGDWETAELAFEEGLILCTRAHNEPEAATIYYELARTAIMRGDNGRHIHDLCDRASALFHRYGMQRAVDMVETLREGIEQLPARRSVPVNKASSEHESSDYILDQHLTRRELEVLQLVAEGHTDREVAEALVISPRTVNRHLSNIFVKLDVPGRAAAVAYALRKGLV